jgi:hypothetical protein
VGGNEPDWAKELEKPGRALGKTLLGMIPRNLGEVRDLAASMAGPAAPGAFLGQALKTGASLASNVETLKTAKPLSQEWWDAAMPLAVAGLQEGGIGLHELRPGAAAEAAAAAEPKPRGGETGGETRITETQPEGTAAGAGAPGQLPTEGGIDGGTAEGTGREDQIPAAGGGGTEGEGQIPLESEEELTAEPAPPVAGAAPAAPEVTPEEVAAKTAEDAQAASAAAPPEQPINAVEVSPEAADAAGERAANRVRAEARPDGGYTQNPLIQFLIDDQGGIMSRTRAREAWGTDKYNANKSLWDSAPEFSDPRHNKIYSKTGGVAPDEAASAAVDAGLLPPGSDASDLFQTVQKVSDASVRQAAIERKQSVADKVAGKQANAFARAVARPAQGEVPINASDLQVGHTLKIRGENFKVTDIDPDTFDVTLEDGSKFGIQKVADGQVFYGEVKGGVRRAIQKSRQERISQPVGPEVYGQAGEDVLRDQGIQPAAEAETASVAAPVAAEAAPEFSGWEPPQLRPGERAGELFQKSDQPFNLAGETGIDYQARAEQAAAEARSAAEAAAKTERESTDLFRPEEARQKAMNAAYKAEGASQQAMGIVAQAPLAPFINEDIIPKVKSVGQGTAKSLRDIRNLFSPVSAGPEAAVMGRIIREHSAAMARETEIAFTKLRDASKLFRRTSNTFNLDVIDRMEKGAPMGNAGLDSFKNQVRQMFDDRVAQVRKLNPNALQNLIEDYFPHIWTRESVERLRGSGNIPTDNPWAAMFGKRPLAGRAGFLEQRSIPTTIDGIAMGLEPVTYNPVDLALLKMREMDRYVMGQKIMQEMKERGLAKFVPAGGGGGVTGYTQINDRIARVFAPKGWKIVDEAGETMPGQKLLGHYWAPDDVARVINNYLSPGLRGFAPYDAFRLAGNLMNQVQLGLSGYHAMFTTIDAATSTLSQGLEQVARSGANPMQLALGMGNIARALAQAPVGGSLLENLWRGEKFLKEYSGPRSTNAQLARIVDAAIAGGARIKMDAFYKTGAVKSFFDAIGKGNYPGAVLRAPLAAIEATAWPIMEYTVPRLKLGIISQMLKYELDKLPLDANRDQVRTVAARVVDSVDNRMGQMIYDNLFWNKALKDSLMASVRSVGWNVGDIRELGGGLLDTLTAPKRMARSLMGNAAASDNPVVTHRMAYLAALPIMVGYLGSIYQYLATGQGPQDLRDMFMPRTGRIKPDGNPERVFLPTYMKDIIPLGLAGARRGVPGLISRAGTMAVNKLHPVLNLLGNMWRNQDYYGTQIVNEGDDLVTAAKKEAAFVASQFKPYSFQGYQRRVGGVEPKAEAFFGIMPTPRELTQTAAEDTASRIYQASLPQGGRTTEERARGQALSVVKSDIRGKDPQQLAADLRAGVQAGYIRPDQLPQLMKSGTRPTLQNQIQNFTPDQAMAVWREANPQERALLQQQIGKKVMQSKTITPQTKIKYLQQLRAQ